MSSSRIRKERTNSSANVSEEHQLWHTIRAHLRSLDKLQTTSAGDLIALEQRRKRFIVNHSDGVDEGEANVQTVKDEVRAAYKKLESDYEQEQLEIANVLEKVEVLMGVVREDAVHNNTLSRHTSSFAESAKRKKRRIDGRSISPTPDSVFSPPPTSVIMDIDGPSETRKRSNTRAGNNTASTGTSSASASASGGIGAGSGAGGTASNRRMTASSSTSNSNAKEIPLLDTPTGTGGSAKGDSYIDPARARREVLAHQLPLKKGRKVAFRQPNKNKVGPGAANVSSQSSSSSSGRPGTSGMTASEAAAAAAAAAAEEEGETWIMATVIECINNDKNRYVVQDDEDPAVPTYNTTLKAVVPLPDHVRTLPPEDYKPGTHVLGLYPDTSCFYRAIVRGGGPGLGGRSSKKAKKPDELLNAPYHLEFEDDDGAIRDVPASLVVERP